MSETTPEQIDLNLDTVEREQADRKPVFRFAAGGQSFTLTQPDELDWKELLEIDDPIAFFRYCMPEDQKDAFKALDIPGWKLGKLIDAFQKHYGIGDKGNGAASRI